MCMPVPASKLCSSLCLARDCFSPRLALAASFPVPTWGLPGSSARCLACAERHNFVMLRPGCMPLRFQTKDFTRRDSPCVSPSCASFCSSRPCDASGFTKSGKCLFYSFLHYSSSPPESPSFISLHHQLSTHFKFNWKHIFSLACGS